MSRYSDRDPYLDEASGVLKNRFRILDEATLEAAEADLVAARSRTLALKPLKSRFDLLHLQAIHRYLFGDVYEWAGQLRTVDISKRNNSFAHHGHIATAANAIFQQLANEKRLSGLERLQQPRRLLPRRVKRPAPIPRRKRQSAARIHQPLGPGERLRCRLGKHAARQPSASSHPLLSRRRIESRGADSRKPQPTQSIAANRLSNRGLR